MKVIKKIRKTNIIQFVLRISKNKDFIHLCMIVFTFTSLPKNLFGNYSIPTTYSIPLSTAYCSATDPSLIINVN
ncbi:MAG: hypothetical protein K0R15_754 [Clostridiales bacterium]|jgi:hypothetical protein|nr:hypothetical protein [Clostridiales bacterium]